MMIAEVLEIIYKRMPAPRDKAVDRLLVGEVSRAVTGVLSAATVTHAVIDEAILRRANLILTYDPIFYGEEVDLAGRGGEHGDVRSVASRKLERLNDAGIAVFRFCEAWRAHEPDGILAGTLKHLGFARYWERRRGPVIELPPRTVRELTDHLKARLDIPSVRLCGDLEAICARIGFLLGNNAGDEQLEMLASGEIDVLVVGETVEWQVCEYIRDRNAYVHPDTPPVHLIVVGRLASVTLGMRYIVDWLTPKIPGVPVSYAPIALPYSYVL
ncbi:Nif3-like dinuclear metal center hexameric protein [Ferroacidibacillus organovorans]|nr:Nif3-like dinuclear metal center hexameric protein [Ferroacidibacillus organovorans]